MATPRLNQICNRILVSSAEYQGAVKLLAATMPPAFSPIGPTPRRDGADDSRARARVGCGRGSSLFSVFLAHQ